MPEQCIPLGERTFPIHSCSHSLIPAFVHSRVDVTMISWFPGLFTGFYPFHPIDSVAKTPRFIQWSHFQLLLDSFVMSLSFHEPSFISGHRMPQALLASCCPSHRTRHFSWLFLWRRVFRSQAQGAGCAHCRRVSSLPGFHRVSLGISLSVYVYDPFYRPIYFLIRVIGHWS